MLELLHKSRRTQGHAIIRTGNKLSCRSEQRAEAGHN